jgi:hypothetical protein
MPTSSKAIIENLISNPKKVFLLDGAGALVTGLLLIVVVIPLHKKFGLPQNALYWLSAIAGLFSVYSIYCAYLKNDQWKRLAAISIANCFYCILTALILLNFTKTVTPLGFAYFTTEIIIIIGLVLLEIRAVKKWKR